MTDIIDIEQGAAMLREAIKGQTQQSVADRLGIPLGTFQGYVQARHALGKPVREFLGLKAVFRVGKTRSGHGMITTKKVVGYRRAEK